MSLHSVAVANASPANQAIADLSALRAIVERSYPALVSELTSAHANAWLEEGMTQAKMLARQAIDETDRLSLLQFYLAGFGDPHLRLVSNAPTEGQWTGFNLSNLNGEAIVSSVAAAWPVALPPVGARLLSFDGLNVQSYIDTRIKPFSDRRPMLAARRLHLALLTNRSSMFPLLRTPPAVTCTFDVCGQTTPFNLQWQSTLEGLCRSFPPSLPGIALEQHAENVVWLSAQTFAGIDRASVQPLLSRLAALTSEYAVVIDLRGNGGGDSLIGHEILHALLKHAMPCVTASARWRVSVLAEHALKAHLDVAEKLNDIHAGALFLQWKALKTAMEKGETWVTDEGMPGDWPPVLGEPFSGPLLLLTDTRCMSACLTFMDVALKHPRVIHIGQETGANTAFTDAGYATLPSGAVVQIPLKEHIGKISGDGAPILPEIPYPGDMENEVDVRAWAIRLAAEQLTVPGAEPSQKP